MTSAIISSEDSKKCTGTETLLCRAATIDNILQRHAFLRTLLLEQGLLK